MSTFGKLIVFEGPDGVGKSTLSQKVASVLTSQGIICEYLTFPGKEPGSLGDIVYKIHHKPSEQNINSLSNTSLQMLHIAAHVDAVENRITPLLSSGTTVILDRYWWSTMVYGLVGGTKKNVLQAMIQVEELCWGEIQPEIIFLITTQSPFRKETDSKTWHKLSTEYSKLAKIEGKKNRVVIIENDDSLEKATDDVVNFLREIFDNSTLTRRKNNQADDQEENLQLDLSLDYQPTPPIRAAGMKPSPTIYTRLLPAKPTKVYDTYWYFAAERQEIFFRKFNNDPAPWTKDPVLNQYKFTNAYRASDRVSQYLIQNVIYKGDTDHQEVFFRILLFKLFNKIETWEILLDEFGEIRYSDYDFKSYDRVLTSAMNKGQRIYSAAYIMASGQSRFGFARKHQNHLQLIEMMMHDELPKQIVETSTMQKVFELLLSYPSIGDFLAFQYTIDINYSELTSFSEMDFVVPGPGARDGIRKCFSDLGGLNEVDIIKLMADRQSDEFERLGVNFKSLWGRPLQLIDCQNLFCEVDKYARVAHPEIGGVSNRKRIKQKYGSVKGHIKYWYPPKWGINKLIC